MWRLLIFEGFSGHGGFAFRQDYIKFNILVAFLSLFNLYNTIDRYRSILADKEYISEKASRGVAKGKY